MLDNKNSDKKFGITFFIIFLVISLFLASDKNKYFLFSLLIALLFFFVSLFIPNYLTKLNNLWTSFGLLLGNIISPLVMGIIYFFVITPTALTLKIFKKDILNLKKNKDA